MRDDLTADIDFEWEVRISRRIRRARLQIKPYGGLEVVIPPRFPRDQIAHFVALHADWVRSHLAEQERRRNAIGLPEVIQLAFDESRVAVIYNQPEEAMNYDLFSPPADQTLFVEGRNYAERIAVLRNWLRQRAWECLPPLLDDLSRRCQLEFKRVSIRSQKTRWGSCSRRGTISLNDQLMFMPPETVEYLMIHELCHTRYLDHSRRFWALVERHCPDFRRHEAVLGQPRDLIPDWFTADLYS